MGFLWSERSNGENENPQIQEVAQMMSSGIDCERKRCGYNEKGRCWYTPSIDEKGRCRYRHESMSGRKWARSGKDGKNV